jgi:hypothetical protein
MPRKNKAVPHAQFNFIQDCQQKRRFKNEVDATKAAELQMLMQPGLELSTYLCNTCGGWHLTNIGKK